MTIDGVCDEGDISEDVLMGKYPYNSVGDRESTDPNEASWGAEEIETVNNSIGYRFCDSPDSAMVDASRSMMAGSEIASSIAGVEALEVYDFLKLFHTMKIS